MLALNASTTDEKYPLAQGMQDAAELLPALTEYVPAGQGVHCCSDVKPVPFE